MALQFHLKMALAGGSAGPPPLQVVETNHCEAMATILPAVVTTTTTTTTIGTLQIRIAMWI